MVRPIKRLHGQPDVVAVGRGQPPSACKDLDDKPERGRKPSIPNAKVARFVTEATRPPKSKTRWSIRSMSLQASPRVRVQRIWSKNDLKPHRVKPF